jgi:hypothetical protein
MSLENKRSGKNRRSGLGRRSGKERRSGFDTRTDEEKRLIGALEFRVDSKTDIPSDAGSQFLENQVWGPSAAGFG